jgi:hypothetical protein
MPNILAGIDSWERDRGFGRTADRSGDDNLVAHDLGSVGIRLGHVDGVGERARVARVPVKDDNGPNAPRPAWL